MLWTCQEAPGWAASHTAPRSVLRWVYELEAAPGGTKLTVTEEGWIGNPFFRVMGNVMGLDATIKQYLRALGRKFGEAVEPA